MVNPNDSYISSGDVNVASFSLKNRIFRALWGFFYLLFFRFSPKTFHKWRALILRCFGAKIGQGCHIYPRATIWAPWNLVCGERVGIANDANIYNPCTIYIGSDAVISQEAYLCGASHDYNDPAFPLIAASIRICDHAWVGARASVLLGVTVREGAVLALGSVASKDLDPWSVYGGVPAKLIAQREKQ